MFNYRISIAILMVGFLALSSCNKGEDKLSIEFVMQNRDNVDAQQFMFDHEEIIIVNWDKQVFKLRDYKKVKDINEYLRFNPAVKSYVALRVNRKLLYKVSIVAINSATKFCSYCPKMFINHGNTILNSDSTINFYVEDIPDVDEKYKKIKEYYSENF